MKDYTLAILIILAITMSAIRIAGDTSQTFQAFAHLYVGWLIGGTYFNWQNRRAALIMMWIAIGLIIVEITCFAIFFNT